MARRGRGPIKLDVDPVENYAFLGPLCDAEVERLGGMKRGNRLTYLSIIYGGATAPYAHVQYLNIVRQRQREGVTSAETKTLPAGDGR